MPNARSSDVSEEFPRPPRTIVVCFDGTNGRYGASNTNVVKFFGLLRKDCPEKQVAYYQAGIGTYFAPGVVSPIWSRWASLLDEAVAWYLDAHVMAGYKFLMNNYQPGDKICLFGFSRGAYTARALAGMVRKVGLLPRDNIQQISFAYKAYTRSDKEGDTLAAGFKQTFSQDVKIDFLGVWDTVQSTGMLISRMLPFTEDNDSIRVFRHALSLDEHRSRFRPNLYHWPAQAGDPNDVPSLEQQASRGLYAIKSAFGRLFKRKSPRAQEETANDGPPVNGAQQNGHSEEVASDTTQPGAEFVAEESYSCTDVLEVWFSGCHSDIGGGNVADNVNVSLAQITLRWMVEHVIESRCGILFDDDALARIGLKALPDSPQPPVNGGKTSPHSDANAGSPLLSETKITQGTEDIAVQELPNQTSRPSQGSGTYYEKSDAIAPLFDELVLNKLWWILEILPCSEAWQDPKGAWHITWSINVGRGRFIPYQKPKFHHTVKERIDQELLKYKPRATYDNDEVYV